MKGVDGANNRKPVESVPCNTTGTASQEWHWGSDHNLISNGNGGCLNALGGNGPQLGAYTCNNPVPANEQWWQTSVTTAPTPIPTPTPTPVPVGGWTSVGSLSVTATLTKKGASTIALAQTGTSEACYIVDSSTQWTLKTESTLADNTTTPYGEWLLDVTDYGYTNGKQVWGPQTVQATVPKTKGTISLNMSVNPKYENMFHVGVGLQSLDGYSSDVIGHPGTNLGSFTGQQVASMSKC